MAAPIPRLMGYKPHPPRFPRPPAPPPMPLWKTSRPGPSATPQRRETEWGPPPPLPAMLTMEQATAALAKWMPKPPPPLLRPPVIPKGPKCRYFRGGREVPPPPRQKVSYREAVRLSRLWRCDHCGETGEGNASDDFAHDEVENCLTGCNGSLRAVPVYGPEPPPPLAPIPAKLVSD